MWFRHISKRQSRALALALLGLVLAVAYVTVVAPYLSVYGESRTRVADLAGQLALQRTVLAEEDVTRRRLAQLERDVDRAAFFLDHETTALASADLQQFVKRAVREAGGRLISTQAMPADSDGNLGAARVRVAMRGDTRTLYTLLYMLEGRKPLVHLDNLELRGLRQRSNVNGGDDMMDIRFDLTGYLRQEARG